MSFVVACTLRQDLLLSQKNISEPQHLLKAFKYAYTACVENWFAQNVVQPEDLSLIFLFCLLCVECQRKNKLVQCLLLRVDNCFPTIMSMPFSKAQAQSLGQIAVGGTHMTGHSRWFRLEKLWEKRLVENPFRRLRMKSIKGPSSTNSNSSVALSDNYSSQHTRHGFFREHFSSLHHHPYRQRGWRRR
jgi:hypothetical protein